MPARWCVIHGLIFVICRFNEDSSIAISGGLDGKVKCWDLKSKRLEPIQTLEECKDSVTSLDVSDHEILVGCADGKIRRYDLRNGALHTDLVGTSAVASACFTGDNHCILVSSSGDTVKLFDKQTGELLNEFAGHVNKNYRVEAVLNHTDHFVLSGSENGFVYVWDMVDGKLVKKLNHALDGAISSGITIHSLAFHPKSAELLTAVQGKVYIWRNAAS